MGKYTNEVVKWLEWDTNFFGIDSYKCSIEKEDDYKCLCEFYQKQDNCFITAINVGNQNKFNLMMSKCFQPMVFLADINISFSKNVVVDEDVDLDTIYFEVSNNYAYDENVVEIAGNFKYSRFFNDPNLGENRLEIYKNWVRNAFGKSEKYYVLAKENGKTIGFILFSFNDVSSATIELIAINNRYRNREIGSFLIKKLNAYLEKLAVKKIYVGTQVSNIEAINFYFKNGFKIHKVHSIYHIWKKTLPI